MSKATGHAGDCALSAAPTARRRSTSAPPKIAHRAADYPGFEAGVAQPPAQLDHVVGNGERHGIIFRAGAAASGYRTYKNNRYAALGAKRTLRTMRQFFRGKDIWMLSRAPDAIEQRTLALFELLNNAGLLQLLQAGIEEENQQAAFERAAREAKRKGEPVPEDPDEAWQRTLERSATQPRHPYGAPVEDE